MRGGIVAFAVSENGDVLCEGGVCARDSLWKLASSAPLLAAAWERARDAHKLANYSQRKISFPHMQLLQSFNSDYELVKRVQNAPR